MKYIVIDNFQNSCKRASSFLFCGRFHGDKMRRYM